MRPGTTATMPRWTCGWQAHEIPERLMQPKSLGGSGGRLFLRVISSKECSLHSQEELLPAVMARTRRGAGRESGIAPLSGGGFGGGKGWQTTDVTRSISFRPTCRSQGWRRVHLNDL